MKLTVDVARVRVYVCVWFQVKFLYDERENNEARSCLLDDGMKECQGAALWVFNNAVFTDTDFENITKLGGATKLSRTDQIGRFGLGFNAVYNVTEVPCFLSRHSIVIFDPHATHLGRCIRDRSRPGVRIDLRRHRRSLRRFGNQFRPWNGVFGCDLLQASAPATTATTHDLTTHGVATDTYQGTLFRLPLRTATQAACSEICNRPYTDRDARDLLRILSEAAESMLMFAQNVTHISIHHLSKRATDAAADMVQMFSAERHLVSVIRELTPTVSPPSTVSADDLNTTNLVANSSVLKAATEVLASLRSGTAVDDVQGVDASMVCTISCSLSPKGAPVLERCASSVATSKTWLICSVMGVDESLKMALLEDFLLPTGAVAVCLDRQEDDSSYSPVPLLLDSVPSGSLFSSMPLPIRHGLPVHINACFAITSSRKYLCQANEDDRFDPRPAWNRALLSDAVCKAYISALGDVARLCSTSDVVPFHALWPNPQFIDTSFSPLLSAFYSEVANPTNQVNPPTLFSDGIRWSSLNNTFFLHSLYASSSVGPLALEVFRGCIADTGNIVCTFPDWLTEAFLSTDDAANNVTCNVFDVSRFFSDMFIPNIGNLVAEQRDVLLLEAVRRHEPGVQSVIQNNASVPCSPKGLAVKRPSDLVDPSSQLAQMFCPEDSRFPSELFCCADILQLLRGLGMKHQLSDVSWLEIAERAQETVLICDDVLARRIVTGLLNVVAQKLASDQHSPASTPSDIQNVVSSVPFLPVMRKPDLFPLPWYDADKSRMCPGELYASECRDLICCIRPVADADVFPKLPPDSSLLLESFLQIDAAHKFPSVDEVLQQLHVIVSHVTEFGIPSTADQFDEFQRVMTHVTDTLQSHCNDVTLRKRIADSLHYTSFVLVSGHLLRPQLIAFNFVHNCFPYLCGVPDTQRQRIGDLLTATGVRDDFNTSDYITALNSMREKYDSEPLDKDSLKLALQLASLLNDAMTEERVTLADIVSSDRTIYIPDSVGVLRSAAELCYNEPDCGWLPTVSVDERLPDDDDFLDSGFSHPLIPYAMSRQLGVSTRRHDMLRKHSRGLRFGQRERLTTRLRRILAAYPCHRELLNEMLQNADDAGATTVHFIKDPRQHGVERLFDPAWKSMQGPALCIYNDRTFSEADLDAIQRLGEGRKSTDPNTTGQYGVGFNCVYHLTDVPSFLTGGPDGGGSLCIFDPHAQYVPGATCHEPGRRFVEIPRLRKIFTDVFSCYLEDLGFDVQNGTMFRLPLRNETMAEHSELSDRAVTLDTVDDLFKKLRPEIFDSLLFLNSVQSVHLSEVDPVSGRLVNTYTVQAQMSDDDAAAKDEFVQSVKVAAKGVCTGLMQLCDIYERSVTYTVTLSDSQGSWERWLVSQKFGFGAGTEIPAAVTEAFARGDLMLMPRGACAALVDASTAHSHLSRRHRVSCFLPLPINYNLPVSINGHFALDHESRRSLWQDEVGGAKSLWNSLLFKHVVAPSYVAVIQAVSHSMGNRLSSDEDILTRYHRLFPRMSAELGGYWLTLIQAVYHGIAHSSIPLLPVVRAPVSQQFLQTGTDSHDDVKVLEWHAIVADKSDNIFFDNLPQTFSDSESFPILRPKPPSRGSGPAGSSRPSSAAERLRRVLLAVGFPLVSLPNNVCDSFQSAGVQVSYISPTSVVDFFASSHCHVADTFPVGIADSKLLDEGVLKLVLSYCLRDNDYASKRLSGLPLLLCHDNLLRSFSVAEPVYRTVHYDLLPGLAHKFLHRAIFESHFSDSAWDNCPVFCSFSVESFAELLHAVLPIGLYGPPNERALRSVEENGPPTGVWLAKLWTFLRLEYEQKCREVGAEKVTAKGIVRPLDDWCLLPVKVSLTNNNVTSSGADGDWDRFVVPVGCAKLVLDYSQVGIMSQPVRRCLSKLGVPELDMDVLVEAAPSTRHHHVHPSVNSSFPRLLASTLDDPRAVIRALDHAAVNQVALLSREECFVLLRYFADLVDTWHDDVELHVMLRSASVHVTVSGDVVSLSGAKQVYTLNESVAAQCNLDAWRLRFGTIFLLYNPALVRLYEVLGCRSISILQLYVDFIFVEFSTFDPSTRQKYIEFLRDVYLPRASPTDRAAVLAALRKLEFVARADGCYCYPENFCDPYHAVFKQMLAKDDLAFPATPFNEFKWLELLRLVGLQTEVSVELFVQFANSVADEVAHSGPSESTFEKSRTLMVHLLRTKGLLCSSVLESIVDIRFIPAARGSSILHKIHLPYHEQSLDGGHGDNLAPPKYITFHEGMLERFESLVWTSAYLLPEWANPYRFCESDMGTYDGMTAAEYWSEVASRLRIPAKPPVGVVVEHMLNLCGHGASVEGHSEDVKAYMRADVMKKVYRYLQSETSDCDDDTRQQLVDRLSCAACVVFDLGRSFLRPSQIAVNLFDEDQLIPYLYRLPSELGEFRELFIRLGATSAATTLQYATVLRKLYDKTAGARLHPNEVRLAFKAVRGLFKSLARYAATAADSVDSLQDVVELYLPTSQNQLHSSTDIVFMDRVSWLDRISSIDRYLLVNLAECGLVSTVDTSSDSLRLLPPHLCPRSLSSVVSETLCERYAGSKNVSTLAERLRSQISSRSFTAGLVRLIRHEHQRSGHKVKISVFDAIRRRLECLEVYTVDRVVTYLMDIDSGQVLSNSEAETTCFVEQRHLATTDETVFTIYISKLVNVDSEELQALVADAVNEISGKLLKNSVHYIRPMLSCAPHAISRTLDRLRVRPDHGSITDDDWRRTALPDPGSFVPVEDHHLLREDFEEFDEGEYVGYELDDESQSTLFGDVTLVYAIIIRKIQGSAGDGQRPDEAVEKKKHGIDERLLIISGRGSNSNVCNRNHHSSSSLNGAPSCALAESYLINVGDDRAPVVAASTSLYKFHRVEVFASAAASAYNSPGGQKLSPSSSAKLSPKIPSSVYADDSVFEPVTPVPPPPPTLQLAVYHNQNRSRSQDSPVAPQRRNTPNGDHGELVQFEFDGSSHTAAADIPAVWLDSSLREETVKREVSASLDAAWQLTDAQRRKVVRRLLLRWHPDKNINDQDFATAITQHIRAELDRLEGQSALDEAGYTADPRNPFSGCESFQRNFASAFKFYAEQMNFKAREHRTQRERYRENFAREYANRTSASSFYAASGSNVPPPSFASSNPQPAQARRFLRQAQEDLRSAGHDLNAEEPSYEWVTFKVYQVCSVCLRLQRGFFWGRGWLPYFLKNY